ncbi:hypothetical protein, partial [uncultured Eubacterium sp.]|uniref:hypothetical protein n=1 Tax=uncultured Eubacterium sp. TaxID=165185 RepID=UPI00260D006D
RKRSRISGLLLIGFAASASASSKHLFLAVLAPDSCDSAQAQSHFRAFANRLRRLRFRQLETFVSRCSCARLMRFCASAIAFPGFCYKKEFLQ